MNRELGNLPRSLQEAIVYFSDPDRALAYAVALRWPNGIACPRCDCREHSFISTRRIWFCKGCKKQFTVKVGTIFEDSPLGMDKWMTAVWLLSSCKNGISSYEIGRDLKVTQKSAWFMMHRIRRAMQTGSFSKLSGQIEADETFIGGKARNMHLSVRQRKISAPGPKGKAVVMGILERGGEVRAKVIGTTRKGEVQREVRKHVEPGSELFTDALRSYEGLSPDFQHQVVDHAECYVKGQIHTNGLENFWSLLKRGLNGTYVSVEPFHLFRYIDEQAFRFNNRKDERGDAGRFQTVMSNTAGRRLTWKRLTGKLPVLETTVN